VLQIPFLAHILFGKPVSTFPGYALDRKDIARDATARLRPAGFGAAAFTRFAFDIEVWLAEP